MDLQSTISHPANIVLAVVIVDIIALVFARNNMAGNVINEWYDKFTFGAFVGDVGSICFGIFLSLALFKYVFPANSFNLVNFIASVVVIQLIHDVLFSQVIHYYPSKSNRMMDVFKNYVNENSWKILIVDAAMMIVSALLIYLFAKVDDVIIYSLLAFSLYFAQFLVYS
jgi:hypothetical protein